MTKNPDIQFLPKEEIKLYQEKRLKESLEYLNANSTFYKRVFAKNHIDINKINTIEDLQVIPYSDKNDLQKYNRDFLCVSEEKVIDYVTTSGTMGDPVTFMITENDLQRLSYNEYLSFSTVGL